MNNNLNRIDAFVGIFVLFAGMIFAQDDAKGVYMDKCSVCHGPDGQAKTAKGRKLKVKSINDTIASEDEAAMINIVSEGKSDMPSFSKQLNGDQIKAVVAFYRSKAK
jgi:mono/diheme cytochrome c family protein